MDGPRIGRPAEPFLNVSDAFAGVDVSVGKKKRLPIVIAHWNQGCLVPYPLRELDILPPSGPGNAGMLHDQTVQSYAAKAANYLRQAAQHLGVRIARIAIDAPKQPCSADTTRRAAERALDAERISCYATPSEVAFKHIKQKTRNHLDAGGPVNRLPHANQLWMLAGFRLFEGLSGIAECIEVYPHATVRALGADTTYKAKSGGAWAQLRAASRFTGWPSESSSAPSASAISWGQLHDRVDAYLAAWVAALPVGERRALGTPPDDVIWIPRLEMDAHAAFVCAGLSGTDPELRKQEYRRRFAGEF